MDHGHAEKPPQGPERRRTLERDVVEQRRYWLREAAMKCLLDIDLTVGAANKTEAVQMAEVSELLSRLQSIHAKWDSLFDAALDGVGSDDSARVAGVVDPNWLPTNR